MSSLAKLPWWGASPLVLNDVRRAIGEPLLSDPCLLQVFLLDTFWEEPWVPRVKAPLDMHPSDRAPCWVNLAGQLLLAGVKIC